MDLEITLRLHRFCLAALFDVSASGVPKQNNQHDFKKLCT